MLDLRMMEALNETTGAVGWTWTPTSGDTKFCRNVVATKNLVFVSTDLAVYAIDIATRQAVWSYPESGELALSANGTLVINVGCRESTGRMVAIKVN